MLKTLNPRAGAYIALLLTPELCSDEQFATVVSFLDKFPNTKALHRVAGGIKFWYEGITRIVEHGRWIVQDQRDGALTFFRNDAHFNSLFVEPEELQSQRWEKLLKSLEQSQARHNHRSQYGNYEPGGEAPTKIREALDACFGCMMQPGWFDTTDGRRFTVYAPETFVEARERALDLYHQATEGANDTNSAPAYTFPVPKGKTAVFEEAEKIARCFGPGSIIVVAAEPDPRAELMDFNQALPQTVPIQIIDIDGFREVLELAKHAVGKPAPGPEPIKSFYDEKSLEALKNVARRVNTGVGAIGPHNVAMCNNGDGHYMEKTGNRYHGLNGYREEHPEPHTSLNPDEEHVHLCSYCRKELEPGHRCKPLSRFFDKITNR